MPLTPVREVVVAAETQGRRWWAWIGAGALLCVGGIRRRTGRVLPADEHGNGRRSRGQLLISNGDGERLPGVGGRGLDRDVGAEHGGDAQRVDGAHRVDARATVEVDSMRGRRGRERVRRGDRPRAVELDHVGLVEPAQLLRDRGVRPEGGGEFVGGGCSTGGSEATQDRVVEGLFGRVGGWARPRHAVNDSTADSPAGSAQHAGAGLSASSDTGVVEANACRSAATEGAPSIPPLVR